jgi:Ulp1 family protease
MVKIHNFRELVLSEFVILHTKSDLIISVKIKTRNFSSCGVFILMLCQLSLDVDYIHT